MSNVCSGKQIRQDLAPWNITNPVISIDITGLLVGISVLIDIVMLIYNTYLADGVGVKIWQKKHQKKKHGYNADYKDIFWW